MCVLDLLLCVSQKTLYLNPCEQRYYSDTSPVRWASVCVGASVSLCACLLPKLSTTACQARSCHCEAVTAMACSTHSCENPATWTSSALINHNFFFSKTIWIHKNSDTKWSPYLWPITCIFSNSFQVDALEPWSIFIFYVFTVYVHTYIWFL